MRETCGKCIGKGEEVQRSMRCVVLFKIVGNGLCGGYVVCVGVFYGVTRASMEELTNFLTLKKITIFCKFPGKLWRDWMCS